MTGVGESGHVRRARRPDETAYAHRGARVNVSIDAIWTDPDRDAASIAWAIPLPRIGEIAARRT